MMVGGYFGKVALDPHLVGRKSRRVGSHPSNVCGNSSRKGEGGKITPGSRGLYQDCGAPLQGCSISAPGW